MKKVKLKQKGFRDELSKFDAPEAVTFGTKLVLDLENNSLSCETSVYASQSALEAGGYPLIRKTSTVDGEVLAEVEKNFEAFFSALPALFAFVEKPRTKALEDLEAKEKKEREMRRLVLQKELEAVGGTVTFAEEKKEGKQ